MTIDAQALGVLLVDERAEVVAVAREVAAVRSYDLVTYGEPGAALAEFESEPERFDLVIARESNRDLAGVSLAAMVRLTRPSMRVVLVRSEGTTQAESSVSASDDIAYFSPPFTAERLSAAIDVARVP